MFTLLEGFKSKKINKRIFFHIHLPKCGGTTIDQIFYRFSKVNSEFVFKRERETKNNENNIYNIKNIINKGKKTYFISGHFNEGYFNSLSKNIFKFSFLNLFKSNFLLQKKSNSDPKVESFVFQFFL